jgi:hypothetical protein
MQQHTWEETLELPQDMVLEATALPLSYMGSCMWKDSNLPHTPNGHFIQV